MTPARLAEYLSAIGWTARALARAVRRDEKAVRQWLDGTAAAPEEVAAWLDRAAAWHTDNPPPRLPARVRRRSSAD